MQKPQINSPHSIGSPHGRTELHARISIPEAVGIICLPELVKLDQMLPIALAGEDIEGVHKVRVALRRIRTCLRFGKPYFEKEFIKPLRKEIKEIGNLFGLVRDLDVLKVNFEANYSIQHGNKEFSRDIWEPVFGNTYQERKSIFVQAAKSEKFENLRTRLGEITETGLGLKENSGDLPKTIREYLPPKVNKKLKTLLSFSFPTGHLPVYEQFHELRLKAKFLRYTMEFFTPVLERKAASTLIKEMVLFQDHLGELNDTVVAERVIDSLNNINLSLQISAELDEFLTYQLSERERLIQSFEPVWSQFLATHPQTVMEAALAPLMIS